MFGVSFRTNKGKAAIKGPRGGRRGRGRGGRVIRVEGQMAQISIVTPHEFNCDSQGIHQRKSC